MPESQVYRRGINRCEKNEGAIAVEIPAKEDVFRIKFGSKRLLVHWKNAPD